MKKTMLIAALSAAFAVSANAQKLEAAKVPASVKTAFAKAYPGQAGKWENEKGLFEAGFKQHGKDMSVLFKADGTMTETEVGIAVSELPAAVTVYIKTHYKDAPIKEAAKITTAEGVVTYEAEVNKIDVLFDNKGSFLKEVKN